ncbi:MAG: rhomboid family intramembrane serine protease [Rhodospirillaceae bacterium]|nr:rhomboid family intramembrane serine protease [Rhodospirillaceae bacterium]
MGGQSDYAIALLASPLTYAFLHGDLLHLVINMAFLLAFGTAVERRLGMGRFLALYIICALLAAGASVALFYVTMEQTIMVGASGAISGLFGAVLRLTMRRAYAAIAVYIGVNLLIGYTGLPVWARSVPSPGRPTSVVSWPALFCCHCLTEWADNLGEATHENNQAAYRAGGNPAGETNPHRHSPLGVHRLRAVVYRNR